MPRKNLLALALSATVTHKPVEILPGCFQPIDVEDPAGERELSGG